MHEICKQNCLFHLFKIHLRWCTTCICLSFNSVVLRLQRWTVCKTNASKCWHYLCRWIEEHLSSRKKRTHTEFILVVSQNWKVIPKHLDVIMCIKYSTMCKMWIITEIWGIFNKIVAFPRISTEINLKEFHQFCHSSWPTSAYAVFFLFPSFAACFFSRFS